MESNKRGAHAQLVKLPPLLKPEATALLYARLHCAAPHLLARGAGAFMRALKDGSGSPAYVAALAQLLAQRPRCAALAADIEAVPGTLARLTRDALLDALERDFNPHGTRFRPPTDAPPAPGAPPPEPLPVQALLGALLDAGARGVFVGDLPALLARRHPGAPPAPAAALHGVLAALEPLLPAAPSHGEPRVALPGAHPLAEAARERYAPSAVHVRGTGCRQLTARAPPLRAPARHVFAGRGGALPAAPVVVLDLVEPRRLDTAKRLVARLLAELTEEAAATGRPGAFALLSCAAAAPEAAAAMLEADAAGVGQRAALEWLATLPAGGERLEWSAFLERVAGLGAGAGAVFLLSDRAPAVSHARVMDEVGATEAEIGRGWRAVVHAVSLDGGAAVDRALRRLARDTGGRFLHAGVSALRHHLAATATPESEAADARAGLAAPGAAVPLLDYTAREGSAGAGRGAAAALPVMLPPPRALVVTRAGLAESLLAEPAAGSARGLRVAVLRADLSEKFSRTFDTWGAQEEGAALAEALAECSPAEVVVLSSFDAWERNFGHVAANALSRCGIDGRRMLKLSEEGKASWEALAKRLGHPPGDDARPEGHGHPVAAVGVPGRKPWGRTVIVNRIGTYAEPASLTVSAAELAAARAEVEAKEAETRASTRVSGTAKVVTPFRWQHEANTGGASAVPYNTLPGHAFTSPSKTMQDPSDPRATRREPPEARSLNPATL